MTQSQTFAHRIRWALLSLALLCWAAGLFWIANVAWPGLKILPHDPQSGMGLFGVMGMPFDIGKGTYWTVVAIYLGVFLLTQWLFLAPRGSWRIEPAQEGRPLRRSVITAALMAALLTLGAAASVMELEGVWVSFAYKDQYEPRYWPMLLALGVLWALWSAAFFLYWLQGDRYTQLGRVVRGLIAGSILETLVAAPVHVWVLSHSTEKEKECYCVRGSYTGLVLGGTVLLWAFGPGVALLFLREKQRREKVLQP